MTVSLTTTLNIAAAEAQSFEVTTSENNPASLKFAPLQVTTLSVASTFPSTSSQFHSSASVKATQLQASPSHKSGMAMTEGVPGCSLMTSAKVSGSISHPLTIPDTMYKPVSAMVIGPNEMASPESVNPLGPCQS